MGRDNFIVKLKSIEGTDEHVMVHHIVRMVSVPAPELGGKDSMPAHTAVYLVGQVEPVRVIEPVVHIIKRCEAYSSVLKEIV